MADIKRLVRSAARLLRDRVWLYHRDEGYAWNRPGLAESIVELHVKNLLDRGMPPIRVPIRAALLAYEEAFREGNPVTGGRSRRVVETVSTYREILNVHGDIVDLEETGAHQLQTWNMELSAKERAEDLTPVEKAAAFLIEQGHWIEPVSTRWEPGVVYVLKSAMPIGGEHEDHFYELKGFSEAEERAVFKMLRTARRGR